MSETVLRKVCGSDKQAFFEMSRDFYSCGAAHEPIPDGYRENFWKEAVSGKLIDAYVIEYEGATAGYALVAYYASQEYGGKMAFFDELYVKPEYRGRGIAKEVFAFVESNCDACRLEVEPSNERALKLYKSMGYKTFEYVQMSKKIKD